MTDEPPGEGGRCRRPRRVRLSAAGEAGDPPRGLVGVGIGGLSLEALVLLLATPAVATAERGHVTPWHIGYLLGLVVLVVLAAARLRRPYGLVPGTAVQPLVIAAGVVTWPMYVVGMLFAGIWLYYLNLWRTSRT